MKNERIGQLHKIFKNFHHIRKKEMLSKINIRI